MAGGRDASQSDFGGSSSGGFGGGGGGGQDYSSIPASTPTTPSPTPSGDGTVDPGFQEALRQQAIQQLALGDPDPEVDVSPEDRDSITSFFDNYSANVKSNPLNLGVIGALKTLYQTQQARDMMAGLPGYGFLESYGGGDTTDTSGGGGEQAFINNAISQRSEEHTSELQSQSTISYAVFCLKKKINRT